jgi:BASS family bile acid:Na+ symporter
MSDTLEVLASLSGLVFVISSMLSMGLSLTMKQIVYPLKNARLVILALIVNFMLVPIVAYLISALFSLDEPLRIGLILLSTAAGAPFLPKLAEVAKGNTAFSVGLMVLLMVVTIIYLPLVLPLLLGNVDVNPWDIAQSLIFLMLIPLAVGLFIKARYDDTAVKLQPTFGQASNIAILVLLVLGVVLNFNQMIALVGSLGILAGIIFIVLALAAGYLIGGSDPGIKSVMGLGTAQRNIAAALVVAVQNFNNDVVTYLIVFSVLGLIILMPIAGELGKRVKVEAESVQQP